jgi:hypothetical protein
MCMRWRVLYECLTGHPPYPGDTLEQLYAGHVATPPPRPSSTNPILPTEFDRVTDKGLAKNPDQRYATTMELARAARDATTVPIPQPASTTAAPTERAPQRTPPPTPPQAPKRADTPPPRVSPVAPLWQPFSPPAARHKPPPVRRPAPAPPAGEPRRRGRRVVAIGKRSGQAVGAGRRVASGLIDVIPIPVIFAGIGQGIFTAASRTKCEELTTFTYCHEQMPPGWKVAPVIAAVVSVVVYCLWNWGYRKGKTGSTIANSILRFKVVSRRYRPTNWAGRHEDRENSRVHSARAGARIHRRDYPRASRCVGRRAAVIRCAWRAHLSSVSPELFGGLSAVGAAR